MFGKYRKLIWSGVLLALGVPIVVFAARDIPLQIGILGRSTVLNIADYIGVVYQYLVGIAGLMAVAMIMYAGMKWIFAGGDSGKITAAKEIISHAIIGLVLALGSYLILNTVNPALVELKVPQVDQIKERRVSGATCDPRDSVVGSTPCGEVRAVPEEGTSCVGLVCTDGTGGCYQVGGEYRCVDPSICPSSCNTINTLAAVTSDALLQLYCDSKICESTIAVGCRSLDEESGNASHPTTRCVDRLREGQGGCNRNEDCVRGFMCNFAEAPNTCRPSSGLSAGIACDNDRQCLSGICNKGFAIDQCAPSGGSPVYHPCGTDRDCGSELGSNRLCNSAFTNDSCVEKGSLKEGKDCDRGELCQSGICEGLGADFDGDCTAP